MGTVANTPKSDTTTASNADWESLNQAYSKLQQKAYATQNVSTPEVEALRDQVTKYISDHVTDPSQKDIMMKSFTKDFTAMTAATKKKEANENDLSNESWDASREDLEVLLNELSPEGASSVWTPNSGVGVADTSQNKSLAVGGSGASAAAGSINGMEMIALDDMIKAFPQLAPYRDVFISAGQKYNIPPQLLAAQAMQESHANPNEPNGGMMQFIPGTWQSVGDPTIDWSQLNASNVQQQVDAAARYDAQLMQAHNNNLDAMLREYNGPVSDKGNPAYQQQIGKWMRGIDGYTG